MVIKFKKMSKWWRVGAFSAKKWYTTAHRSSRAFCCFEKHKMSNTMLIKIPKIKVKKCERKWENPLSSFLSFSFSPRPCDVCWGDRGTCFKKTYTHVLRNDDELSCSPRLLWCVWSLDGVGLPSTSLKIPFQWRIFFFLRFVGAKNFRFHYSLGHVMGQSQLSIEWVKSFFVWMWWDRAPAWKSRREKLRLRLLVSN